MVTNLVDPREQDSKLVVANAKEHPNLCCGGVVWSLSCVHSCDPMDCSLPGSSVHGILQARILEWVAISFSKFIL